MFLHFLDFGVRHAVTQNSGSNKIIVPNGGHGPVPLVLSLYFTLPPPTLTSPFTSEEKGKYFYCKEGGRGRSERGPHVNIPLGANKNTKRKLCKINYAIMMCSISNYCGELMASIRLSLKKAPCLN